MIILHDRIKHFYYSDEENIKNQIFKELRSMPGGKKVRRHLEYKYIDFMKYAFLDYLNTRGIFLSYSRRDSIEIIKTILTNIYIERIQRLVNEPIGEIVTKPEKTKLLVSDKLTKKDISNINKMLKYGVKEISLLKGKIIGIAPSEIYFDDLIEKGDEDD